MSTVAERIVHCEQGSAEWFTARLGCVTSTRIAAVTAKRMRASKGKAITDELGCRWELKVELACELLTGNASDHYVSRWMKEGKEKEPFARAEYELLYDVEVQQIGFIYHPTIARAGSSLDGLIGDDGILEIKSPKVETHIRYLLDGIIPEEYESQMGWQLACDETRQWNDFVSYCPELPQDYRIFRKRMERTKELDAINRGRELEVIQFLSEVDKLLDRLKENR